MPSMSRKHAKWNLETLKIDRSLTIVIARFPIQSHALIYSLLYFKKINISLLVLPLGVWWSVLAHLEMFQSRGFVTPHICRRICIVFHTYSKPLSEYSFLYLLSESSTTVVKFLLKREINTKMQMKLITMPAAISLIRFSNISSLIRMILEKFNINWNDHPDLDEGERLIWNTFKNVLSAGVKCARPGLKSQRISVLIQRCTYPDIFWDSASFFRIQNKSAQLFFSIFRDNLKYINFEEQKAKRCFL